MKRFLLPCAALILFVGCNQTRSLLGGSSSPRQQYAEHLEAAGLSSVLMTRRWHEAGEAAVQRPAAVALPYSEEGFFPPEAPRASGLRFSVPRGQRITVSIRVRPDTGARLFADLWRTAGGENPKLITGIEAPADSFSYVAEDEGEILTLQLQPELLAAVSYTLTITGAPSLGFPVKGGEPKDIGSRWGDPRDAGARKHEGIDIFGARGKPLVAAAPGTVTRVGEGGLGGKVVWLRPDERPFTLYYAHLDSQIAQAGQRVMAGETVGLMGNTGNARGTSPHLHFGIYAAGGAVNPYYYVAGATGPPPLVSGRTFLLDSFVRADGPSRLFLDQKENGGTLLPAGTALRILAASGRHYRVQTAEGSVGWLHTGSQTSLARPLRTIRLKEPADLLHAPQENAAVVARIAGGTEARVLALTGAWQYVSANGFRGWIQAE